MRDLRVALATSVTVLMSAMGRVAKVAKRLPIDAARTGATAAPNFELPGAARVPTCAARILGERSSELGAATRPLANTWPSCSRHSRTAGGAEIFGTGLWIALPLIAMLLFVNLVLGMVSRVASQINIFAIGFPVTLGVGLVGILLTLPAMQQPFAMVLERLLTQFR